MAVHYDSGYAWGTTPCGKSLHGWANISRRKPMQITTNVRAVTCKLCLKKMK